jgi:hypothetical protein
MKRPRDEEHQYAMKEDGEWVHASKAVKGGPYYCECPDRHALKLVHPSGREDKRKFTPYFAHYGGCSCVSGGESQIHRLGKQRLRELASSLSFTIEECSACERQKVFKSNGHTVRLEIRSSDGLWRYDCLLYDPADVAVFALEVVHTHFSSELKIDSTRKNIGFAEFAVEDIMQSQDGRLENLTVIRGVCIDCLYAEAREDDYEKTVLDEMDNLIFTTLLQATLQEKCFFGEFFIDISKSDETIHFLTGYDDSQDIAQQRELRMIMAHAQARFEVVRSPPELLPPRASKVFCYDFLKKLTMEERKQKILDAILSMWPLSHEYQTQLIAALSLICRHNRKFAHKVFDALRRHRSPREVSWIYKLFSSFLRLGVTGALQMSADPVLVVGWLVELRTSHLPVGYK